MLSSTYLTNRIRLYLTFIIATLTMVGCGAPEAEFRLNSVYVRKQENAANAKLTARQKQDIVDLLSAMFGTPDQPQLPVLAHSAMDDVLDVGMLQMAAGPVSSDQTGRPQGLYREHCAHCHGINGDGAGPTAAFLNPYPRDYRRGIFKFKTTPGPTSPPTHDDLKLILINGIPGTAMPSFRLLNDNELESLVQYVKYLAIRGEVERALIFESSDQLGPEDRLLDPALRERDPARFSAQVAYLNSLAADVVQKWNDASANVTEIPARPADWDLKVSVAKGRELFFGTVANCVKCHGDTALGDGQTTDYDEWTKEIIDPQNPQAVQQYLAMGALPPRNIKPRNLRQGIYRGGHRPIDIYWRIHNGIAGSPMPAAPMKPAGAGPEDKRLTTDDVWHLVDYVRSLPYESVSKPWHDQELFQRDRL
jgi:mono/diheme cytochrome c family protein